MTTDQAPPAARTSDRGAATRSGLLAAAREVFTSVGYAQAGVTEIVTRAGASVGSLYHQFSGKAELYLTLFVRGDSPPGFDLVRRQRLVEWSGRNAECFARSGEPLDEAVSIVMTGALMLAVAEISLSADAEHARRIVDGVLQVLSRIEIPSR